MKAKSIKKRFLIMLQALYKHSDEIHRMNTVHINKYLEPYNLECTSRSLLDTVKVLQECGVTVKRKGVFDSQGFWIEDKLISDEALTKLLFALTTNDNIGNNDISAVINGLQPLMHEHQEEYAKRFITGFKTASDSDSLLAMCETVLYAIKNNMRIKFRKPYVRFKEETNLVVKEYGCFNLFWPQQLFSYNHEIYVFGYNFFSRKVELVNLRKILELQVAFKKKAIKDTVLSKIQNLLKDQDPGSYVEKDSSEIIYQGPISLRFRGQYLNEVYDKFGSPIKVQRTERCIIKYDIENGHITAETLLWLFSHIEGDICITGPKECKRLVLDTLEDWRKHIK